MRESQIKDSFNNANYNEDDSEQEIIVRRQSFLDEYNDLVVPVRELSKRNFNYKLIYYQPY